MATARHDMLDARSRTIGPVEEMRGRIGPMAVVASEWMRRTAVLKMRN